MNATSRLIVRYLALFGLAAAAGLVRCVSLPTIAGGGSSDQGNAIVTGSIYGSDTVPASGVVVTIVREDFLPGPDSPVPDSMADTTDEEGKYRIRIHDSGTYNIYSEDGNGSWSAIQRKIGVDTDDDTVHADNDTLLPTRTLHMAAPETLSGFIAIRGTPLFRAIDPAAIGFVLFVNAPADPMVAVSLVDAAQGTTVVLQTPVALVDDFNDNDKYNSLVNFTGNGLWNAYSDRDSGGVSLLEPAGALADFGAAITESGAYRGKSAALRCVLRSGSYPSPYAGFWTFLSPGYNRYTDLSSMTALSFMCKGRGTLRVQFRTLAATTPYAAKDAWGQLGAIVRIPASWQRVVIPIDSLVPPDGSVQKSDSLKWKNVCGSVETLIFAAWDPAGDTTDIVLDDISLVNVSDRTFGK